MNWINWEYIEDEPIEMFKTGTFIDNVDTIGGIMRGALTVICGTTGNGKSMFAGQLAYLMSQHHKVAYLSMENPAKLDRGRFEDFKNRFGFKAKFNYCRALVNVKDLEVPADTEVLFIDSFDFILENSMEGVAKNGFESSVAGNELCKRLIALAETHNIAVVVTAQLNAEAASKDIDGYRSSEIKGSISISQKAAHIWAIQNSNGFKIRMLKARYGILSDKLYHVSKIGSFALDLTVNDPHLITSPSKGYRK